MNYVYGRTSKAVKACLILLLLSGTGAGCASSSSQPEQRRSNAKANVQVPSCSGNLVPMCVKHMGVVIGCSCSSVYDFEMTAIDGKSVKLSRYQGDVLMIVNVASK